MSLKSQANGVYLSLKSSQNNPHVKIGVLGCMAERLKTKILEKDKSVDVICGPDAVSFASFSLRK